MDDDKDRELSDTDNEDDATDDNAQSSGDSKRRRTAPGDAPRRSSSGGLMKVWSDVERDKICELWPLYYPNRPIAWEKIGAEVGRTPSQCKNYVQNHREIFRAIEAQHGIRPRSGSTLSDPRQGGYACGTCGLPKRGHTCPGYLVAGTSEERAANRAAADDDDDDDAVDPGLCRDYDPTIDTVLELRKDVRAGYHVSEQMHPAPQIRVNGVMPRPGSVIEASLIDFSTYQSDAPKALEGVLEGDTELDVPSEGGAFVSFSDLTPVETSVGLGSSTAPMAVCLRFTLKEPTVDDPNVYQRLTTLCTRDFSIVPANVGIPSLRPSELRGGGASSSSSSSSSGGGGGGGGGAGKRASAAASPAAAEGKREKPEKRKAAAAAAAALASDTPGASSVAADAATPPAPKGKGGRPRKQVIDPAVLAIKPAACKCGAASNCCEELRRATDQIRLLFTSLNSPQLAAVPPSALLDTFQSWVASTADAWSTNAPEAADGDIVEEVEESGKVAVAPASPGSAGAVADDPMAA